MRISDWSSDVCSSDLLVLDRLPLGKNVADRRGVGGQVVGHEAIDLIWIDAARRPDVPPLFGVRRIGHVEIAEVGDREYDVPAAIKLIVRLAARAAVEHAPEDRQSVVSGKSVSVRVDLGGRRIIKKKKTIYHLRKIRTTNEN